MPAFPVTEYDAHHDYAHSISLASDIHISEVTKRGRQGYLCIGCRREMQAVLPKIQGRRPFFRHDPKFIKPGEHCAFRDEEYRNKLAITTLEFNKEIRVPPVYKYPPKGEPGLALFLFPGATVTAARVEKYKYFYESEYGNVESSFDYEGAGEDLLFKADVVFYDENDEPILFIQVGKRKKLSINEQAGLRRLRVNTINLTVPKDSEQLIANSQKKGDQAKWLYHDDEQQISYFSVPSDLGEGIPAIDGDQDRLSEESYDCRKVQINNLIRALGRCLESEPYRQTEQGVRTAIGKTQLAIARAAEQREGFEKKHRTALEEQYQPEFDAIGQRRELLELAFGHLRDRQANLEGRYRAKKIEIEATGRSVAAQLRAAAIALGSPGKPIEELESELRSEHEEAIERMGRDFERAIESVKLERGRIEKYIRSEGTDLGRKQQDLKNMPGEFAAIQESEGKQFDEKEEFEDNATKQINARREKRPGDFSQTLGQIDVNFNARYHESEAGLSEGFDHILSDGPLRAVVEAGSYYLRLRKAKEFLESTAFKTWVSGRKR